MLTRGGLSPKEMATTVGPIPHKSYTGDDETGNESPGLELARDETAESPTYCTKSDDPRLNELGLQHCSVRLVAGKLKSSSAEMQ